MTDHLNKSRYTLSAVTAILLYFSGMPNVVSQSMFVREKCNDQYDYSISGIIKICFKPDTLEIIKVHGSSDKYSFNELRYLSFNDYSSVFPAFTKPSENKVIIYPDPADDFLTIRFLETDNIIRVFEILSFDGTIVKSQTSASETDILNINIAELSNGIYLCRIYSGTKTETLKFIKLKVL